MFGNRAVYSVSTDWWVIADEKTCYVILHARYGWVPHGFGEFYSLITEDRYKGFVAGHQSSNFMTDRSYASMMNGYERHGVIVYRNIDGELNGSYFRLEGSVLPEGHARSNCLNGTEYAAPLVVGTLYPVFPAWRYIDEYCHGKLRGVYYPGAYQPKDHAEEFLWEGRNMLSINMGGSNDGGSRYKGQIWFDITGSWEESV